MAKDRTWMPLFIPDYLADTEHLSAAESGAYLHLIMHYWVRGCLPAEEDRIRRVSRLTTRQWARSRDLLKSLFDVHWRHKRIDLELAQAFEKSRVNSANARLSHPRSQPTLTLTPTLTSPSSLSSLQNQPSPLSTGEKTHFRSGEKEGEVKTPKHGAKSKDGQFVYFRKGTGEYDAYVADYQEGKGEPPTVSATGRWFRVNGEVISGLMARG
jgi:uncharacterized protein YdaU (DUF1376 family)